LCTEIAVCPVKENIFPAHGYFLKQVRNRFQKYNSSIFKKNKKQIKIYRIVSFPPRERHMYFITVKKRGFICKTHIGIGARI